MKIDPKQIMQQVQLNHNKLDNCPRHDFSIDLDPAKVFGKRWQCTHCTGTVDSIIKDWYERGLRHGGQ